jgi:hypothetical protein
VHLDMIREGLKLSCHLRQPQTLGSAKSIWVGASAIIAVKVKIRQDALMASGGYLSFDVLSTAMIPGNRRKIVSDAGSGAYVLSSEF